MMLTSVRGALWLSVASLLYSAEKAESGTNPPATVPIPIHQEMPVLPDELARLGIPGEVTVDFMVNKKGKVKNAKAVKQTNEAFAAPAVACVEKWRFKPAMRDGVAVPAHMQVPIVFEGSGPKWSNSDFQAVLAIAADVPDGRVVSRGWRLTMIPVLGQFALDKNSSYDLRYSLVVLRGEAVIFRRDFSVWRVLATPEFRKRGIAPEGAAWDVPESAELGVYRVTIEAQDRVSGQSSQKSYEITVREKPNKALEPTTTAVTSPAAQEPRQP